MKRNLSTYPRLVTLQGYKTNRFKGCSTAYSGNVSPEYMGSISALISKIPVVGDIVSEIFGLDSDEDVKKILQAQVAAEQERNQTLTMMLAIGVPAVAIIALMVARSGKK